MQRHAIEARQSGAAGRVAARAALPAAAAFLLAGLAMVGCAAPAPPAAPEVQAVWRDALPAAPEAGAWKGIPQYQADMIPQDLVDPRLLKPSTARLGVQAVTDGSKVAFRLTWADATRNELPGSAQFSDACAIQVPQRTAPDLPDPQMGQAGRPVEITFWRASWQASVAGREDTIRSIHPGAVVDHYPFEAPSLQPGSEAQQTFATRYAPAAALGARREGPRERPVEDLVAEGPGTLRPAVGPVSEGSGRRTADGWEVLIVRPLPNGLTPGGRSQIAFGVWDGSQGEVGARKMRSGWVPMSIEARGGRAAGMAQGAAGAGGGGQ
jgi:DMSO reductase family type II enzyme heme b subunit